MGTEESPARVTYEYVVKAYDVIVAAHVRVAERANKLIVVQALLFAALSFGLTNLGWIGDHPPEPPAQLFWVFYCTTAGIGLFAAVFLACAFFAALQCQRMEQLHVPSTHWIGVDARKPYFLQWTGEKVLASLSLNVRRAIESNVNGEPVVEKWAARLNRWLLIGFILTVAFLAATSIQRVVLSVTDSSPISKENHRMCEEEKNNDEQEDKPPRTEEDIIEDPEMVIGKRTRPEIETEDGRADTSGP